MRGDGEGGRNVVVWVEVGRKLLEWMDCGSGKEESSASGCVPV